MRMTGRLSTLSIRHQLWALFGLLLLTGATVLVIDEIAQYRARQSLLTLKDDALLRMQRIKAVSDGYGLDIVDTTFRARNYLITFEQGVAVVDAARARIDDNWHALALMPRNPAQTALFDEIARARSRADAAAVQLRAILVEQDIVKLAHFADTALYPSIDPVTTRLQRLANLAMLQAEAVVHADIVRGQRVSLLRIGLSLLALLVVALVGRTVLRNAYHGIESLGWLARRMQQHDYTVQPRRELQGEFGEVMATFLRMRSDVLGFETELNDQLLHNERIRGELEQRHDFQTSLLASAQTAILVIDRDGRWTVFNPFAERLLGWRADEILGRVVRHGQAPQADDGPMLVAPEQVEATAARLTAKLGRDVPTDWRALYELADLRLPPAEAQLLHKDGHAVPVLLAMSSFHAADGQRAGVIIVAADLSALKELERAVRDSEARAQEANHAKSAFLAAMSHEIRTPMIGVTGMIEVLAHTPLDADQRRALNVIQSSAQSLLQIIGDILDFSKIEAGRLELAPAAADVALVLQGTVANFSGSASSKGLTLTCDIEDGIAPAYYADALRLRQILGNFLSNAIKFTAHGQVQAALELVRRDDDGGHDRLCFRITDTGIGISVPAQARLFQPFAQAEGDTTRRFGGTGLGLAISRRLAELMDGTVTMESVPGLGTSLRLTVTLPRAPAHELQAEPHAAAAAAFTPRRLPSIEQAERERSLVLLVDDHPTNRLVIARQLALAGYASECAEDGVAALELWRSGRHALVLSDVHMPRMDGYQLARAIREAEANTGAARTPIVALTASALQGESERCLAAGMDDYLAKPVGIATLVQCLSRWLPHVAAGHDSASGDGDAGDVRSADIAVPLPQLAHPAPLDPSVLDALTGGNLADTRELLDDYLRATAQDLAELDAARAAGNLAALTRQAHKIKGAARIVGALDLAETAQQLEAAGQREAWSAILPLATDVATAAERLRLHVAERFTD